MIIKSREADLSRWHVYLVCCSDGTYYCGIAKDVFKRVWEHNYSPHGAKYTRGRRHVILVYLEEFETKSEALKREFAVKKIKHNKKRQMADDWIESHRLT